MSVGQNSVITYGHICGLWSPFLVRLRYPSACHPQAANPSGNLNKLMGMKWWQLEMGSGEWQWCPRGLLQRLSSLHQRGRQGGHPWPAEWTAQGPRKGCGRRFEGIFFRLQTSQPPLAVSSTVRELVRITGSSIMQAEGSKWASRRCFS